MAEVKERGLICTGWRIEGLEDSWEGWVKHVIESLRESGGR